MAHARRRFAASSHAARSVVKNFAADISGATAIEYTLLVMMIAIVIVAAITNIGTSVNGMIKNAANGLR